MAALEKATADKEAHGEFESACPGYCGAQDPFYVGTLKGVGRIYQQTFIEPYRKVGFAKLYDPKTPVTAADRFNDRVLPFFEQHAIPLNRVRTDRGTEYCGAPDRHEYELSLAVENEARACLVNTAWEQGFGRLESDTIKHQETGIANIDL